MGRHVAGRWCVEEQPSGRLREAAGVTRRCFVTDSTGDDAGDED